MNAPATMAAEVEMVANLLTPKRERKRVVLGRRQAEVNGHFYQFSLQADGVHVRLKRGWRKKERVVSFVDLVHVANGQGLLKL